MSCVRYRLSAALVPLIAAALAAVPAAGAQPLARPALKLPRVAWEGGPAYWFRYARADALGFDKRTLFPVSVFYNYGDSDAQVAWDKNHVGLNTYIQGNSSVYDYAPSVKYRMFTFGGPPSGGLGSRQVGNSLDDEVDGRFDLPDGLRTIDEEAADSPSGVANYINWTSGIVTYDRSESFSSAYINNSKLALNSLDQYFYSVPQCDWGEQALRWRTPSEAVNSRGVPGTAITPTDCRTASSYGKMIDLLRQVDNDDHALKPIWGVVEVVSPGGGTDGWHQPSGDEVTAAAYNSVVHEARGIMWFDTAPENADHNDCATGGALRDARIGTSCPAIVQNVAAVSAFNAWLKAMSPVLNTQSYVWNFGDVDTMLKVRGGSAYVFAAPLDARTGTKTFALPPGLNGRTVEVLGEDRTIPVTSGTFTDTFAHEWSHHTYRIPLA